MDLNDLRRDRKAAADTMGATADQLVTLETETPEDADAIAAAQTAFDTAKAKFDKLDAQVKTKEAAETAALASAVSESNTLPDPHRQPAQARTPEERGAEAGIMIGAYLRANGDRDRAVKDLEVNGHSGLSAALATTTEGAGGVTLPRPTSATLIELLQPMVVVRRMGTPTHDMPAGTLRNARLASAATAAYAGELDEIAVSEPTFDKVDEAFKKLTSLVPVSNSLLRYTSTSMGMLIRDHLLRQMALREDLAFIRGDGTNDTPIGVRNFAPGANWQAAVANGAAAVEASLRAMKSALEDANVPMLRPGWMMRASTKNFLADLRDPTGGNRLFPSIDDRNMLHGWPIGTTSQIPNNLGAGSDETEVYLVDFSEMMIGDAMDIQVAVSTEAAYNDGGNTRSAFQKDMTLFRAISEHDFASAHDAAIAGANGVDWG